MEDALDQFYEFFDDEICEQVSEYMEKFGSISIDQLIGEGIKQTIQHKKQYQQLIPDATSSRKNTSPDRILHS